MRARYDESELTKNGIADPHAWLTALLRDDSPDELFKDDSRSRVASHTVEGQCWVVKRCHTAAWKRMLYGLIGRTPAQREWAGAMQLRRLGIRAATPIALVHRDTLIYPHYDGSTLHDWLRETTDASHRLRVAAAVGRQIGQLTGAGCVNRDHKPTNLIIDARCDEGDAEPIVIDPAGLRRRTNARILRMFALLYRASRRARGIAIREGLTALRAAIKADPTLHRGPVAPLARKVLAMVNARPLSDEPADSV